MEQSTPQFAHSPDFRSVLWNGILFTFTPTQAACVAVLWESSRNGVPEVGQETILELADSKARRLADVFRLSGDGRKTHPAWGWMIVSGATRGSYQLADPPSGELVGARTCARTCDARCSLRWSEDEPEATG